MTEHHVHLKVTATTDDTGSVTRIVPELEGSETVIVTTGLEMLKLGIHLMESKLEDHGVDIDTARLSMDDTDATEYTGTITQDDPAHPLNQ